MRQLQLNLVRSHACGIGEPLAAPIVRRMLLLKANSLAAGISGVRTEIVDALHSSGTVDLDHLSVRFVPRTDVRPEDDISVGRVSVYREGQ